MAIKVLIADDHSLLRDGIKQVLNLENDLEVVGEAENGQLTLARTMFLRPDILLLDLNMPVLNGFEIIKKLCAAKVTTKIIVLTIHDDDGYMLEALKKGARGYLLKDVEPQTLIKAIHMVNDGKVFVESELAERVFEVKEGEKADLVEVALEKWREKHYARLSQREREVLYCIARGLSNKEIAAKLFISEATVKGHMKNIFQKLNVSGRTQALLYGVKHKLINLESSEFIMR